MRKLTITCDRCKREIPDSDRTHSLVAITQKPFRPLTPSESDQLLNEELELCPRCVVSFTALLTSWKEQMT
jgi:hypothetical protein